MLKNGNVGNVDTPYVGIDHNIIVMIIPDYGKLGNNDKIISTN